MSLLRSLQQTTNRPTDREAYNFLMRHLEKTQVAMNFDGNEAYDERVKPTQCEHLDELTAAMRRKVPLSQPAIDCFYVGLAVNVSLKIPGPLLWVHFVGESSSLKTTLARFISSASDKCYSVSKFKGLYSGYKSGDTDTSLVPKLQGRVLVINDLTPLLQADKGTQDEVFGDLRDIYEGVGGAHFKNGVNRNYDGVVFGCITCVTDVIRKFGRSDLGERFIMSEINADYDERGRFRPVPTDTSVQGNAFDSVLDTIASGLDKSGDDSPDIDNLAEERSLCWGYINHLHDWISDESGNLASLARAIKTDVHYKGQIDALAEWLEHARCPLPKKNEESVCRPRPALPHRSIKQLTKLTICLCIVFKSVGLTDDIKRIVRNKAFDTCQGWTLEVMNFLATHPNYPKVLLSVKTSLSTTYITHICEHLITIGVVEQTQENNGTGRRGRNGVHYSLTDKFRALADTIGLKPDVTPELKVVTDRPLKGLRALLNKKPEGSSLLPHHKESKTG